MFKSVGALFLYTETPLHVGSGTSFGVADLPIQREKHTYFPIVQSSGLKGVMRQFIKESLYKNAEEVINETLSIIFGPEGERASDHGGALSFSDARIVLFPVRSLNGVFTWITCPLALERFKRDMGLLGQQINWQLPSDLKHGALTSENCVVLVDEDNIVLEEYTFKTSKSDSVSAVAKFLSLSALPDDKEHSYWSEKLYNETGNSSSLVILSDTDFADFVRLSTELITRTRIDHEKGTVASGALWTEEHLPMDSLLYCMLLCADPKSNKTQPPAELANAEKILQFMKSKLTNKNLIQLGGDETVGRGLVKVRYMTGGA